MVSFQLVFKSFSMTSPSKNNLKNTMEDTRQKDAHENNENYTVLWISKQSGLLIISQSKKRLLRARALYNRPATNIITRRRLSLLRRRGFFIHARNVQYFYTRRWKTNQRVFRNTCGTVWSTGETSKPFSVSYHEVSHARFLSVDCCWSL